MDHHDVLAERFEAHRARLRAVAYQALGSASEADDTDGRPITLAAFTITGRKIVAIDLIDDPHRIAAADLAILG